MKVFQWNVSAADAVLQIADATGAHKKVGNLEDVAEFSISRSGSRVLILKAIGMWNFFADFASFVNSALVISIRCGSMNEMSVYVATP